MDGVFEIDEARGAVLDDDVEDVEIAVQGPRRAGAVGPWQE
jgi:hypothetical protein